MNMNRLINMGIRLLMNKGVKIAASRGKKPEDMTPQDREQAIAAQQTASLRRSDLFDVIPG